MFRCLVRQTSSLSLLLCQHVKHVLIRRNKKKKILVGDLIASLHPAIVGLIASALYRTSVQMDRIDAIDT